MGKLLIWIYDARIYMEQLQLRTSYFGLFQFNEDICTRYDICKARRNERRDK